MKSAPPVERHLMKLAIGRCEFRGVARLGFSILILAAFQRRACRRSRGM